MFRRNAKDPPGTMGRTKQEPRKANPKEAVPQKAQNPSNLAQGSSANPPVEGASANAVNSASLGAAASGSGSVRSDVSNPKAKMPPPPASDILEVGPRKMSGA